ncbi:MAG: hypothetical protein JWM16_5426, partial [Verrucomicrobiales bacterium]|nr:hypothetical protein [Verrucomicrobiales bacterium]
MGKTDRNFGMRVREPVTWSVAMKPSKPAWRTIVSIARKHSSNSSLKR